MNPQTTCGFTGKHGQAPSSLDDVPRPLVPIPPLMTELPAGSAQQQLRVEFERHWGGLPLHYLPFYGSFPNMFM